MDPASRAPAGPRGVAGASAEDAAAAHLRALGWSVLARNLRLGPDELDIVALEPGPGPCLVIVEVRSRSGPRFGAAVESVDARKVRRLYRAAFSLARGGHPAVAAERLGTSGWRVDLLTLRRSASGSVSSASGWVVEAHLRGLLPP